MIMAAARMAMPPATPPTIAPVLLLLELEAPVGTMIIVERRVVVITTPSASVELKKKTSDEKNDTHEVYRAYMSSDEKTEVNVEVIGGAPELRVI
jgi:hypothetical protein